MCSDTQNYQQAELKKKKRNPRLDSDWRKNKFVCVCVCAVGGWGANEWHCLKTVILLLYFYLSVSDTFGSPQHWLVSERRGSWWQNLVRGWSTNQIPCAASLWGPELYLYTSESFEISVEFNSLCLPHQRKTPERFPHAPSERQSFSERLSSAVC